jgi:flagellar hook assembly protein FlgD
MLLLSASCGVNPLHPNIITNLRFSPDTFDSYQRNTSLKYSLLKEAEVSISIYDSNGIIVKTLIENLLETKGSHSHGWLGISDSGTFVPTGIYLAQVTADYHQAFTSVEIFHY